MPSHHGARRGRRDALADWWPAEQCIAAPMPVDRHRNLSMAITMVALTLLFLALAMFGPAQPGSAEQATVAVPDHVATPAAVDVNVGGPATRDLVPGDAYTAPVTTSGAR